MKPPRASVGLIAIALLVFVAPATAQYMYLDTNGDGVNTAADQVNPAGPTVIDIWLDTDSNRDGSPAVCSTDSQANFRINSYEFVLSATGGTMSWGTFTNNQPSMGLHGPLLNTETEYYDGYFGFTYLAPGTYRLGTLQATVATGAPSVQIVPNPVGGGGYPLETAFGSACPGDWGDNTMRLGIDWFDVDGLPFGSGGSANSPPSLTQPADMVVSVGEPASQSLAATDVDRQPVTFSKVSGPAYATVTTVASGSGSASGRVFVAPRIGDVGPATVTVNATDGIAAVQKSFTVMVNSGSNHLPTLVGQGNVEVVAGTTGRLRLYAIDPDGQTLAFSKIAGPDFAEVSTLVSGSGAGAGNLRLAPEPCDAGPSAVTIGLTDGISTQHTNIDVEVRASSISAPSPPPYPVATRANTVAVGDLNSDGNLDVVTASGLSEASISVLLAHGDGTLGAAMNFPLTGKYPFSIAIGDLDRDGHPDLAVTMLVDAAILILKGRGDGSFAEGVTLAVGPFPLSVKMADFNGDGKLDLVAANRFGTTVSLFVGVGDGTFGPRTDVEMGSGPYALEIADFNLDGRLDLAAATFSSRAVAICLGFGDGTFGERREIPIPGAGFGLVAGDWNWDGKIDLAAGVYEGGQVAILLGDGDGGFHPGQEITGFLTPQSMAAEDMNGDGNLDLLIADPAETDESRSIAEISYGRGDGTFGTRRDLGLGPLMALAAGDMNRDGYPDAIVTNGNQVTLWLNDAGAANAAQARGFLKTLDRVLRGGGPSARTCINVEPVAGSYLNKDLNLGSITLSSEGTGSVSQISTAGPANAGEKDSDGNGIPEISACFARADLAKLFDKIQGKQTVTARLDGTLTDCRRVWANVDFEVDSSHRQFAASISPNPLNPQASLRFSTSQDGFVRVRMFDLNGRLVRTLFDRPLVTAGDHQVTVDGRGGNGGMLASGIYFYQVEALEGTLRGRFTILK